jgi:hypothetical protein
LFAHEIRQNQFFQAFPEHYETAQRIAGDYWPNAILNVEQLLRETVSKDASIRIAYAVFERTKDATVRTNLLLFMNLAIQNASEHKEFIYSIVGRYSREPSVLISALRTLRSLYVDEADTFNWFIRYLTHPDGNVAREAFNGAVSSRLFASRLDSINEYAMTRASKRARQIHLSKVARLVSPRTLQAVYDWSKGAYLDFEEPITMKELKKNADSMLREREKFESFKSNDRAHLIESLATAWQRDIYFLAKKYGLPLNVEG